MEGDNLDQGGMRIFKAGPREYMMPGEAEVPTVVVCELIWGEFNNEIIAALEEHGYEAYPSPSGRTIHQPVNTFGDAERRRIQGLSNE